MGKRIFNKNIPHLCEYCEYGKAIGFNNETLCKKRGVTGKHDSCRKFKYDCLKRVPKPVTVAGDFKAEDFKI